MLAFAMLHSCADVGGDLHDVLLRVVGAIVAGPVGDQVSLSSTGALSAIDLDTVETQAAGAPLVDLESEIERGVTLEVGRIER